MEPILRTMGATVTLTGKVGAGNVTKLANQIMVAVNIAAMSEALALATKAGLDPEVVFNAVKAGLAGSTVLNVKAPMVYSRNFKPGFRIRLHQKDLRNALLAVVSAFGFTFAALLSEAVVTETVFALPGIGRLVVQSILRRDYPVIQGVILVIVVVYLLINLIVDLSYRLLDPRVELQ